MKIRKIFASILLAFVLVAVPTTALAHEGEAGEVQAAQTTTNQPIDVPKTTTTPIDQNSGFTDENGNPISVEEYNKQRAESTKGVFEKYPVITVLVAVVVVGGIGFLIFKKVKKQPKAN